MRRRWNILPLVILSIFSCYWHTESTENLVINIVRTVELPRCDSRKPLPGSWVATAIEKVRGSVRWEHGMTYNSFENVFHPKMNKFIDHWERRRGVEYSRWIHRNGFPIFTPTGCKLDEISSTAIKGLLHDRVIVFSGDSVTQHHYQSFIYELFNMFPEDVIQYQNFSSTTHSTVLSSDGSLLRVLYRGDETFVPGMIPATPCQSGSHNCVFIISLNSIICFINSRVRGLVRNIQINSAIAYTRTLNLSNSDYMIINTGLHYENAGDDFTDVIRKVSEAHSATDPKIIWREISPQAFLGGKYVTYTEDCCLKLSKEGVGGHPARYSKYDWANIVSNPILEKSQIDILRIWWSTAIQNSTDMRKGHCTDEITAGCNLPCEYYYGPLNATDPQQQVGCNTVDGTHYVVGGHTYHHWTRLLYHQLRSSVQTQPNTRRDMKQLFLTISNSIMSCKADAFSELNYGHIGFLKKLDKQTQRRKMRDKLKREGKLNRYTKKPRRR